MQGWISRRLRVFAIAGTAALVLLATGGCSKDDGLEVVVYTALDQTYSEPILDDFEAQTGIRVKVAYDTEATKTTGLVNRIIAEKAVPRADVFWNNEVAQTIVLKNQGLLQPYESPATERIAARFKDNDGYWTGFAARARVIIYNTDLVTEPPKSIYDFTKPEWRGDAAIALPLFGTTATHAAALFEGLGDDAAKRLFRDLKANDVAILPGNATVRDMVAQGEFKVGLTDTDDANGAVEDGLPAHWLFPDQGENEIGTLLIPNSVCLIKDCPHPEAAKRLIDYLLSPEVEIALAKRRSMQIPLNPEVTAPASVPRIERIKTMDVDFAGLASRMEACATFIREEFTP
ncbi:MAG: extracellular solute-binding protein [Candidatus Hydrogenedentes bacterium]|nr:extracellular solute-binding protein [Candidatus Hydrogenedentota bacterium]